MLQYMRLQHAYMEYGVLYIRLDIKYYEVASATAIGLLAGGVAIAP